MINTDLHVAIVPPPWNQGEDFNWIYYVIIGHTDENKVDKEVLKPIFSDFLSLPIMDGESDEWEDLDEDDQIQLFMKFMSDLDYTVFQPTPGICWLVKYKEMI